jgi:hypothetical protein
MMIERNAVKNRWGLGIALGIGLTAAMGSGCGAQSEGEGLAPEQREQLRALGIDRVESSGDLHALYDANGVEVGTVEIEGTRADVVLGGRSATLTRGVLSAEIACDDMDPRAADSAGALAAFIDDAGLSPECVRALHVGRIVSAFDTGHAPGCEVEAVDGQSRLYCDQEAKSTVFRNLPGGDDCVCDEVPWGGWCPPQCWSCGAGACDGGGDGGGDIGGDGGGGPVCWYFNRSFDATHAEEELLYGDPLTLCPGAQADAEQMCLESLIVECTAEASGATVIDAGCADGSDKDVVGCWCTVRVQCHYFEE